MMYLQGNRIVPSCQMELAYIPGGIKDHDHCYKNCNMSGTSPASYGRAGLEGGNRASHGPAVPALIRLDRPRIFRFPNTATPSYAMSRIRW